MVPELICVLHAACRMMHAVLQATSTGVGRTYGRDGGHGGTDGTRAMGVRMAVSMRRVMEVMGVQRGWVDG